MSTQDTTTKYTALTTTPKFRFTARDGGSGVTEIYVDAGQFGFAHIGWSAPLIRAHGKLYAAEEVLKNIGWVDFPRASIGYGAGPRKRRFVEVTDRVIDGIHKAGSRTNCRSDRERARAIEVAAFADGLIELL